MLFLYRPRQTWIPYRVARPPTEQAAYNRELQDRFGATRRVPPPTPASASQGLAAAPVNTGPPVEDVAARLKELAELHAGGALTDEEFAAAKGQVLGTAPSAP